jgi:hypothetical protein
MAKTKPSPLGSNPLKSPSEQVLRDMVRGESSRRPSTNTSVTPGGLLRKTIYFQPEEWKAIREECFRKDVKYTELVRAAVRAYLNLESE